MSDLSDNGTPVPGTLQAIPDDVARSRSERLRASVLDATAGLGVAAASDGSAFSASELRAELLNLAGGGGDGKGNRRKNWIAQILIAIVAIAGTAFAAYKATEARSVANEEAVKSNEDAIDSNTKAIGEVKDSVDDIAIAVDRGLDGIDQLKQEAQTAKQKNLEDDLADLKRENRQLKRERDR